MARVLCVLLGLWAAGVAGEEGLCGLNGCQAIDFAKRYTDLTMAKMMHTIKPDAMEEVFESMARLEALVRKVEDLRRDTGSLLQPGNTGIGKSLRQRGLEVLNLRVNSKISE